MLSLRGTSSPDLSGKTFLMHQQVSLSLCPYLSDSLPLSLSLSLPMSLSLFLYLYVSVSLFSTSISDCVSLLPVSTPPSSLSLSLSPGLSPSPDL